MHGQLGHGKDIRYLANPRLLDRDQFAGHHVALIQCGEQYSAAITEDGQLYMWGKNSHVIPCQDESQTIFYEPTKVDLGERRLSTLACGSWHAIAITGKPDCDGWMEEFSESEVEDESDTETCTCRSDNVQDELQALLQQEQHNPDLDEDSLLHDIYLDRQKTVLSLGEFYAPTPALSSPPGRSTLRYKNHFKGQSIRTLRQQEVVVDGGKSSKENTSDQSVLTESIFLDIKSETTNIITKPKQLPQRLSVKPYFKPKPAMVSRSRTFSEGTSRGVGHSVVLSKYGVFNFSHMTNKIPEKSVGFQVSRLHLRGDKDSDISNHQKYQAFHRPQKLTKAHTIYGRYNPSLHVGSQLENTPTFDPNVLQKYSPDTKLKQHFKMTQQQRSFFELSPQVSRTSKSYMARKPLPLNTKAAFSSASSWQQRRTKTGPWVVGESMKKQEDDKSED